MKNRIQIVVAEDRPVLRRSLVTFLQTFEQFEVIGEASNGNELLDVIGVQIPDIVLLDLNMPVVDGWQAVKVMKQSYSNIKIIVFSNWDRQNSMEDLKQSGVVSFVSKTDPLEVLYQTILEACQNNFAAQNLAG
jgi:DNA-binding NarL/FixJ family response regulator